MQATLYKPTRIVYHHLHQPSSTQASMTRIISISSWQTNTQQGLLTQQLQTVTKLRILTRLYCEIKIEEKKRNID